MTIQFPIDVTLDKNEYTINAMAAVIRVAESLIEKGRKETHGSKRDTTLARHIEAKCAEGAFAKGTNQYCSPVGKVFGPDLGDDLQVRHNMHSSQGLLVRPSDDDAHLFFYVTGQLGRYTVHGWMDGWHAKQECYEDAPDPSRPPCYVVPVGDLNREWTKHL